MIPEIWGLLEVQDVLSILGGAWTTPLKIEFKKMIMYVSFSYSIRNIMDENGPSWEKTKNNPH
jgi:hypothetical protein